MHVICGLGPSQSKILATPMALTNNLDNEKDVGTINYELKIRGAKQLACCSKSHAKAKLFDLVELKPKKKNFESIIKCYSNFRNYASVERHTTKFDEARLILKRSPAISK